MVEIIVAAAVMLTVVTFVVVSLQFYIRFAARTAEMTAAAILTEEGGEALQYLRDMGWDENIELLSLETDYYLYWNGSTYLATTTPTTSGGSFYRTFSLESVLRDGSDAVSESGTEDPNTRLVTFRISHTSGEELFTTELLLHNVYEN